MLALLAATSSGPHSLRRTPPAPRRLPGLRITGEGNATAARCSDGLGRLANSCRRDVHTTATVVPREPGSLAMGFPIPELAPVTSATFSRHLVGRSGAPSSVDDVLDPVDVAALVGHEEGHQARDFVGLSEPAEGDGLGEPFGVGDVA